MVEEPIDSGSLAAILAADYPLIDPPLILAILSDYPSSELSSNIPAIKDQLGILEATLVPDPDLPEIPTESAESWTESTSLSGIDEISNRLDGLNTNSTSNGTGSRNSDRSEGEGSEDFGDESELLKSLFPSISENDLNSVLHLYPTLQDAIDHLLSLELIRNVEEEGHWPDEDDVQVHSEPEREEWKASQTKKSKNKIKSKPPSRVSSRPPSVESSPLVTSILKFDNDNFPSAHSRSSTAGSSTSISSLATGSGSKKKKKDTITIPLVDTLQRKPSPAPSRSRPISRPDTASNSRSSSPARNAITNSKSGPTNNAWHTVTSLSSYLSDLIPTQQPNYFLTYLHSPEYHSAYSAILASLAKLPPTSTKNRKDNSSRKILEDIYGISLLDEKGTGGEKDIKRDLEICVHAAGEDIATVMDLMELLNEISDWPNDDDYGIFESKLQPDYTINNNPISTTIIRPQTVSLQLPPAQAIDMARTTSNSSTISNKSFDDHISVKPPKSSIPGKMTRPEKKVKPIIVKEEHLSGGAIREAKIREVPGSKLSSTSLSHPTALDSFGITSPIPSSPKLGSKSSKQVHIQNWRTVSHARPTSTNGVKSKDYGIGAREKKLTVEECIQNANLERARRETAIRAAGRSFKTNVNGISGGGRAVKGVVAGHYAIQAREAAERAKQWELKAARLVVTSHLSSAQPKRSIPLGMNGSTSSNLSEKGGNKTIDLHHLTINEGITVVNELINDWWKFEKEIRLEKWKKQQEGKFIIITGVGRHSINNKGVLGPAVAASLEKDGWKVDRGDSERGYLVVRGR